MNYKFPLIVFDADDTMRECIIEGQKVPTSEDEWRLLPGVREKLATIEWGPPHHGGTAIGIASNQSWVGKGRVSKKVARQLLVDMVRRATGLEPPPFLIEMCPHLAEDDCKCRKPRPFMLKALIDKCNIAMGEMLFVGNSLSDRDAARLTGCWFAWAKDYFRQPMKAVISEAQR